MLRIHKRQAERAFTQYIKKKARSKKVILIVCHGNIIRYMICRALGIDTLNWVKLDICQGALSVISYHKKRKALEVVSHNDAGHIPLRYQTFV
jgi:serine/threonine-protein phosphatase PGAM5